jgi:hypothetical protein
MLSGEIPKGSRDDPDNIPNHAFGYRNVIGSAEA